MNSITKITAMLSEEIQRELAAEYTLSDMEKGTRRLFQEIGWRAIAIMVNSEDKPHPAPEVTCDGCSQAMPFLLRRQAWLETLFRGVEAQRAYYLFSECHQDGCPLDKRLWLRPNAISAELERLAAMNGGAFAIWQGRDLFQTLTLVSLSDQTLVKAT